MASSLRELRQRRKSVSATMKITKAMELIAASKVIRARQTAQRALPYTRELNRAVSALATHASVEHPLTTPVKQVRRAALLIITSDRGMNGAYSSNAIKTAARMRIRLEQQGVEVKRYAVGRKIINYCNFRQLPVERSWEGFSDAPTYAEAHEIADALIADFLSPYEEGGVDEIHAVYTRMESMLTQVPRARRLLPLEVVAETTAAGAHEVIPQYEFEPDPETVLDELMPLYVRSRVWFYLLQSAASQLASQQRAMKSATDNANQLIESLTREANQARQAEITQEITEIVGGASALAEASAD
ncbi:MAG TPA: F0F1 ATP synthase subunit gamma [Propioniciclava sp.]|uniref:F0F1 ATP synthase subunit gamma n=1 Tax=Propioniciclava sp. TaxID=2038686 RepID=UPI002C3BC1DA|nr:F0F1 ATP synthase subunit gamma [Propioniciclava sp.]HRL48423.1 F0F1 ATP synthase subunit gamma [Propioniciclava sp.]